ncbi:MAG: hypothetical protein R2932_45210 [Caldilineaceae bacterium]
MIYLAETGRVHRRYALAELFWADALASKRANLKRALGNLRNLGDVSLIEQRQELVAQHTQAADKCYVTEDIPLPCYVLRIIISQVFLYDGMG